MRILVMGAGGVGGYFGAQLARAGHDVAFVARGAHLAAMREKGLVLESEIAPAHLRSVTAEADPARLGPADIVMFCTKLWDVEDGARRVAPALSPEGLVIPFQNGVEAHLMLAKVLGKDRVAGGVAQISANIKAPGVIEQIGQFARLRVGVFCRSQEPLLRAFVDAGTKAKVDIEMVGNIDRALWEKFVFLVAMSGLTSLARQPLGIVRADPELRTTLVAAIEETVAVARKRGITLAPDVADATMKIVDALPPGMRASMLNDLARGNRLEAPWLAGAVMRMAREAGLAAPVNTTIFAALKPYLNGSASPPEKAA